VRREVRSVNAQDPRSAVVQGIEGLGLDRTALVLFDFDGVVADSEIISLATLQAALADFGLRLSLEETRARFLGTSLRRITSYLEAHGTGGAEGFAAHWQGALFARFQEALRPVPHVLEALDVLEARAIPFCIASSGTFERIHLALDAMQVRERFANIFSAEQVARGKPAPDLFLYAAQQMGVASQDCLVIEDSPFGVSGAKAAGMRCAGFLGGAHCSEDLEAHARLLKEAGADHILRRFGPASV
jgi:HAD superfamily hydrolase (TIGR01509 family)